MPSCPSGNCLLIPTRIVLDPNTSVLPCGGVGVLDIPNVDGYDVSNCGGSIVWSVVSYNTTAFTTVSVNSSGELTFTTTSNAVVGSFYSIVVKALCDEAPYLSQFIEIRIPIRDACLLAVCDSGEHCDPCSGFCVPDEGPDLIIE